MTRRRPGVRIAWLATGLLVLAACGSSDDNAVSAEFTGDGCVYSGPTKFDVGDELEITVGDVTEERMDVGFAVNKVRDGTSVADIREKGISEFATEGHGTFLSSGVTKEGTERVLSTTLDIGGTWVVQCFVFGTGNPDGQGFPATTFEVVGGS